jgi:hypothetical protein
MSARRPYAQIYDANENVPVEMQVDSPLTSEFVTIEAKNVHSVIDPQNRTMHVGDAAVNPHGNKSVIWSSEGYSYRGVPVPALTSAQKAASGTDATNIALAPSHSGFTIPTTLDLSFYRSLLLMLVLTSFTGGTSPSIQFELDFFDDTATPNKFILWNPAAAVAAASYFVEVGPGLTVPPASAPTGYVNSTVPTGWTVYAIPSIVAPNGKFSWTVTGAPTGVAWTAWLYGQY